ncbi:MAG: thioesterase domain-containing protein [Microcystis sp.]
MGEDSVLGFHLLGILTFSLSTQIFFFCANAISHATSLTKYLETEYSFYFVESGYSLFLKENRVTEENIQALASHHVQDILSIQPEGNYRLAGCSFGSLVAYEIAKQLEQKGKKVAFCCR